MITRRALAAAFSACAVAAVAPGAVVGTLVGAAGPAGASPASTASTGRGPANSLGIDTGVHALAGVGPVVYGLGTFPDTVTLSLSTAHGLVPMASATPNDPSSSMGSRDFVLKGAPLPAGAFDVAVIEETPAHAVVAKVAYRLVVDRLDTTGCPSAAAVLPVARHATDASVTGVVRTRCVGAWAVAHVALADTGMSDGGGNSSPRDGFVLLHRSGSRVSPVGTAGACRRHQIPPALVFEACGNTLVTLGTFSMYVPQPER